MPPKAPKQWPPVARLTLVLQSNQTITVSTAGTIPGKTGQGRNRTDSQLKSWVIFWGDNQQQSGSGPPPSTLSHSYVNNESTVFVKLLVTDVNTLTAQATISVTLPGSVLAPPTDVTAVLQLANSVLLSWTYPTGGATQFQIYRGTPSPLTLLATVDGALRSYTDSGLTASTTYAYTVAAVSGSQVSAQSATASATTSAAPAAPSLLSANAVSTSQIDLSWTDNSSNEDGFQIERSVSGSFSLIATVGAGVTTFSDTGLAASTPYSYRVRAYNVLGASAYSNTASATTNTAVPSAPTNLTATAISASAINLAWTNTATNATSITVQRRISPAAFGTIATLGPTATTYPDTGLSASTTYDYRVLASNAAGDSTPSNTASATTLAAVTPPAAPSSLNAVAASASAINLTWTDNSSNESGFAIERATGAGAFTQIATVGAGVTAFGDTGLNQSQLYRYQVRAYNAAGFSAFSNQSSATTNLAVPNAPTSLAATATTPTNVHLTWTAPATDSTHGAATSILVQRRISPAAFATIQTVGAGTTSYDDATALASTTYDYRLLASNGAGNSSASNTASVTTPAALPSPPSAPSALSAVAASATLVNLSWTDNASTETGFVIQRSTSGGAFSNLATVAANTVSFADGTVVASTSYQYRVYAYNAGGNSANSNTASVTTPSASPPNAPSLLVATAQSTTSIQLTWQDNSTTEQGFSIERKLTGGVYTVIKTLAPNITSYLDTVLTPSTTYTYRIRAFNANGNSAYSNESTATTPASPPTGPIVVLSVTPTTVQVGETVTASTVGTMAGPAPLAGWQMGWGDGIFENGTGTPPLSFTHVYAAAGTYGPALDVSDTDGNVVTRYASPAITVTGSQPVPPNAPSNLAGTRTAPTQATLTWQDNSTNEDGFNVERKLTSASTYANIANPTTNVTSYQDNTVAQGSSYNYRVRAFNTVGNSGYSNVITVGLPTGADYYVAPGGNDSGPGTLSQPFATLLHAMQVAAANLTGGGKTIWARGATYDESWYVGALTGTSWTNRIRLANYPGETVWMTPSSGEYNMHFRDACKYLEFDGINLDATNCTFGMIKAEAAPGESSGFIRCMNAEWIMGTVDIGFLNSGPDPYALGGNEMIRLRVHGATAQPNPNALPNEPFYLGSSNNLVEFCEVYDVIGGGGQVNGAYGQRMDNNIIRNNYWHDIVMFDITDPFSRIWAFTIYGGTLNNNFFYNNVIARIGNGGSALQFGFSCGGGAVNTHVWNNTVYAVNGRGFHLNQDGQTGGEFKNNVAFGCTQNMGGIDPTMAASNNITDGTDPRFVSTSNSDFHVQDGSPCIDGGIPSPYFTTDKDGVLRPQRSAWDIGAYEKP